MYNFFVDKQNKQDSCYLIDGKDFNHIANVLRMQVGEKILVSESGSTALCQIKEFCDSHLLAEILQENYQDTELPIRVYLFQGMPKGDKFELIIQKAVELGVTDIVPVEMARSIVKIESKKVESKVSRWQAIVESAAKQCKRNVVPTVHNPVSTKLSLDLAKTLDVVLVPYESKNGMQDTLAALKNIQKGCGVGVYVGPEGGFDNKEIDLLTTLPQTHVVSLGKRILRTETASITTLSMIMLYAETCM